MADKDEVAAICIFEDDRFPNFFPLTLNRPVYDLLLGTQTTLQRICAELSPDRLSILCRPYLAEVQKETVRASAADEGSGDVVLSVNEVGDSPVLFVNGRILAYGDELERMIENLEEDTMLARNGLPVAVRLSGEKARSFAGLVLEGLSDEQVAKVFNRLSSASAGKGDGKARKGLDFEGWAARNDVSIEETGAKLLSYHWQLVQENAPCLVDDFGKMPLRGAAPESELFRGVDIINEDDIVIGPDVEVRSGTVLDASEGPIIISSGVMIEPNAIIKGPCFIGSKAIIRGGAKVGNGTSIGANCRIGGEVGESVICPYTNKQHEGFLGHSYIGSWVNLGAGSCNSDLKNNYGKIRAWSAGQMRETGRQFLGFVCGDHAKIAINTRINTGTVIGFNANVFMDGFPPKFIPSFTWSIAPDHEEYDLDEALETARVMMDRRETSLSEAGAEQFRKIFKLCRVAGHNV